MRILSVYNDKAEFWSDFEENFDVLDSLQSNEIESDNDNLMKRDICSYFNESEDRPCTKGDVNFDLILKRKWGENPKCKVEEVWQKTRTCM